MGNALLKLSQNFIKVFFPRQSVHYFQLGEFHVYWVIVFAKENFDVVFEDGRPALDDQEYVPQGNILYLRTG